ncbi:helix-turn-helix domain-containing protein [Clostridium butyricum]|uniref:helix-turn-helix domain-containing protein n=1 Tax=Clostridium butyricum TaxID=1492 RepID=UPI002052AC34|nr:MAG TPA: helix-turn-helix domain protein [Caudoviricetes sp.]
MKISDRIYLLRDRLQLSQDAFGSKIGVTKYSISSYEKGKNTVKDRVIADICREFNVNEEWLRNGSEPMFVKTSNELVDQIASKYNFSIAEKQALQAYVELSDSDREKISELIQNIFSGFFKVSNEEAATAEDTSTNNIDYEVESYRKELEAEQKGQILSASEKPKGA